MRRASTKDLNRIYKIELECFGENAFTKNLLSYLLSADGTVCLVAEVDDQVVGFIMGCLEFDGEVKGHIFTLDVSEDYRRRGIASKLLGSIEKSFLDAGAGSCCLEVHVKNYAALNLYRRNGYSVEKIIRNYYGPGLDAYVMRKNLTENR